jgi:hypothetical protein
VTKATALSRMLIEPLRHHPTTRRQSGHCLTKSDNRLLADMVV